MTGCLPLCAAVLAAAAALPGSEACFQASEKYHTAWELLSRLEALSELRRDPHGLYGELVTIARPTGSEFRVAGMREEPRGAD